MSVLTPYSRDALRGMKAQVDEEKRLLRMGRIIGQIHMNAVQQARTTQNNKYKFQVPVTLIPQPGYLPQEISAQNEEVAFYNDNMKDILECLRELFPGCSVKFTSITMAMGNDRKMYDVSDLDEKALAFVNNPQKNSYIIVDWS